MIPFAILQGKIEYESGRELEIRVLELSKDFATFRVPVGFESEGAIVGIIFSYYIQHENRFESVSLRDYSISKMEKERFAVYYMISCKEASFAKMSEVVTKEYLRYIELKLDGDDVTMSHEMTGGRYPKSEKISTGSIQKEVEKWIERVAVSAGVSENFTPFLWLNKPSKCEAFLKNGIKGVSLKLDKAIGFGGVAIGSIGCEELFPDEEMLRGVLRRAAKDKLKVLVEVPPVSENRVEEFSKRVQAIESCGTKVYVQFNDLGMYDFGKRALEGRPGVSVEKGVMLYKSRRDPRKKYIGDESENDMRSARTLWGPFYQTNTGTFCPLHALVCNGDRGKNERVVRCDRYCENYHLEYPDHLMMVGDENSLWGFDEGFLLDERFKLGTMWAKEQDLSLKVERVVINL